ncbi:hypothetical protein B0T19DRAFT_436012 [Cercophora scortea]|uniref:Zn(2)-C6 fungal-type domain-containing protein n=1 Tax=Cercophora scortea TaxID=314031 RepID=A0AAE0J1C4_9PEZI|nr:hypothetical protein B0T19DRAFT_436012 [Cercophora scortea]
MTTNSSQDHHHISSLARSIHCFRAIDPTPRTTTSARPRAKFTQERKDKVREVRRKGACLRCRILKIQCSNEDPCQSCLQSAVKGHERKVLSFCYCVRTRFSDVNIFQSANVTASEMQIDNLMARMGGLLARIALPASFSADLHKANFNHTLSSWLTNPNLSFPNGSIVGLCCSSLLSIQFQEDPASADLVAEFQTFLLASSLAQSGWRGKDVGRRDVCTAGQVSGYRLIKRLDRVLTPQFLSKCSREDSQILFLLVLGTILGVNYSSRSTESPSFPTEMLGAEFQQSPTLWLAMKEHLCQMLAHHLIFLGSILGIKLETGLEQRIIDTAIRRWNKMETFIWADGISQDPSQQQREPPADDRRKNLALHEAWNQNGYSWENPPPAPPPLVTIPCPEVRQLQGIDQWAENPASYLSMADPSTSPYAEPESYNTEIRQHMASTTPRSNTDPVPADRQDVHTPWRTVRRRSMWVVRSFDAGERGKVNVHARLRGREVNDFGLFV